MSERLRVLVSFPFSIYPPRSGGGLRCYYLLRELARHFDTTALVIDDVRPLQTALLKELADECGSLTILRIPDYRRPRTLAGRLWHRLQTWTRTGDSSIPTGAVQFELHTLTMQCLQQQPADIVIGTNLESWPIIRAVRRRQQHCLTVIDFHNIESDLKRRTLESARQLPENDQGFRSLRRQESLVSQCADLGFVCSDDDGRSLANATGYALQISVVPNGVACERSPFDNNPRKKELDHVLFCGTLNYRPNIDGLNWFLQNVWPVALQQRPQLRLKIVGRGYCASNFPLLAANSSVDVIGEVADVAEYYQSTGVAICPLLSGSGTRLKILEAMSFGTPVVSTSIGCEGLQMRHGAELLVCDDAEGFAKGILTLLEDGSTFDALRKQARHRVEELYDWRVVGDVVQRTLVETVRNRQQRRRLV